MTSDEMFIGGTLPEPLSEKEIYELFYDAQNGKREAYEKIGEHNIRLVLSRVMDNFGYVDYDKRELVALGNVGLAKAISKFDLTRNVSFSTYAVPWIDNEIRMFLRKVKKEPKLCSMDEIVFTNEEGSSLTKEYHIKDDTNIEEEYEKNIIDSLLRNLVEELPSQEKEIIKMYFGFYNDKVISQPKIADKFNCSQATISLKLKRILGQLKEKCKDMGILDSYDRSNDDKISEIDKSKKDSSNPLVNKKKPIEYQGYVNLCKIIKSSSFEEMMKSLDRKDALIVSLKLGYIDGKTFSSTSIARVLGIDKEEVNDVTRRVLHDYVEKVKNNKHNKVKVKTNTSKKVI